MMNKLQSFIDNNRTRIMDEYFSLLRIESVSTGNTHLAGCREAADYLVKLMEVGGFDSAEILETSGNPLAYGEKHRGDGLPTVLIYGHYDVMPASPEDGWSTGPFEPVLKDNTVYGRGSQDNKGQLFMVLKTAEYLISGNFLNCNLKCLFEGEEECGSSALTAYLEEHADLFSCDTLLVCDSDMIDEETLALYISLRGAAVLDIEVNGPSRDLHSGLYGGAVVNPLTELVRVAGSMYDNDGRVLIPGFYDDVREYNQEERGELALQPFDEEELKHSVDVSELGGEKGYSALERTVIRPTLELTGLAGGHSGDGIKAIVPSSAGIKLFARLVSDQNPDRICESIISYFKNELSPTVKMEVKRDIRKEAFICDTSGKYFEYMDRACEQVWGIKPVRVRGGGSIPIVLSFKKKLKVDPILIGFGLPSDSIHGPDEHFDLIRMWKGMETVCAFFTEFPGL